MNLKLIPILVIAVCIGAYFLYISPAIVEVQTLSAKAAEYAAVLEKSKELANQRDAVLTSYNSITEADVARLSKVIPETFDSVLFANDINAMATRHSLSIKEFKVNEPKTEARDQVIQQPSGQAYKVTAVSLVLNGPFETFVSFLKDVESSLRLVDVSGLSVKSATGQRVVSSQLEYVLEMSTYSLR